MPIDLRLEIEGDTNRPTIELSTENGARLYMMARAWRAMVGDLQQRLEIEIDLPERMRSLDDALREMASQLTEAGLTIEPGQD